eukprot:1189586-Prorocentrum_minimum.AAC.3
MPLRRQLAELLCLTGINWKVVSTYEPKTMHDSTRARHRHCITDRQDLIKPSYYLRIQFSHQFFTDAICPCRALD